MNCCNRPTAQSVEQLERGRHPPVMSWMGPERAGMGRLDERMQTEAAVGAAGCADAVFDWKDRREPTEEEVRKDLLVLQRGMVM